MKIAIHDSSKSFSERWIAYCKQHDVSYKIVNCYSSSILSEMEDCDILMWHHNHSHPKDILFAKQLLFALEHAGKTVFPDFHTAWHFDDKVGQKYLLEAIGAPLVPSYVFYDKKEALDWVKRAYFPKVFKLRSGAGSAHVSLVKDAHSAKSLIRKAFTRGFARYNGLTNLRERWRKYRLGKTGLRDVMKGIVRLFYTTDHARMAGREKGYVYFQDFIPGNDHDIRIIVIDGKAFGIKRMVRENDFRASGSGSIRYEKSLFDENVIKLSFKLARKLKSQCVAFDYVFRGEEPLIVEISYGYIKEVYFPCEGYWDERMNWHEGHFDSQGWMIESIIRNRRLKS